MKATKLIIIVVLFLITNFMTAFTQTLEWERSQSIGVNVAGAYGHDMEIDNSGNAIISGARNSPPKSLSIKYNSSGTQEWSQEYGSGVIESSEDVAIDSTGNIYITGRTGGSGFGGNMYTAKYNSAGTLQWSNIYDGGYGYTFGVAVCIDKQGNVFVTGKVMVRSSPTLYHTVTIKYNSSGSQQWLRKFGGDALKHDEPKSIALDDSGNVIITGISVMSVASSSDIVTFKYDTNGNLKWYRSYGGSDNIEDEGKCVSVSKQGYIYVTGYCRSAGTRIVTLKYDRDGYNLWTRLYTPNGTSLPSDLKIDSKGNVILTGKIDVSGQYNSCITLKYDSLGVLLWDKQYNSTGLIDDFGTGLCIDSDDNVYITGGSGQKMISIKYDTNGDSLWVLRYNSYINQSGKSIRVNSLGKVYIFGKGYDSGSSAFFITMKYSQSTTKTLQLKALIEGLYNITKNKMIKDTARVYLRNTSSPYAIIDSAKSVLDTNGKGTFSFPNAINGTPYYIVVKHRNSIDTWSASGQSFTSNSMIYDFTTSADKAYGNNLIQKGSRFCIYSGDVNRDGSINLTDLIAINNDLANFVTGYNPTDINGDNQSDLFDMVIAYNNSLKFITAQYPGSLDISKSAILQKKSNEIKKFELRDNYPNPFNPKTVISYELRVTNYVSLKVYDIAGKEVAVLVNEKQEAGNHSVIFDATNLSTGVYFYKLESDGLTKVKRMMLVK